MLDYQREKLCPTDASIFRDLLGYVQSRVITLRRVRVLSGSSPPPPSLSGPPHTHISRNYIPPHTWIYLAFFTPILLRQDPHDLPSTTMKIRKPLRSATGAHTLLPATHITHEHVLVALGTLPVRTFLRLVFGRSTVVRLHSILYSAYILIVRDRSGAFGLQCCFTLYGQLVSSLSCG